MKLLPPLLAVLTLVANAPAAEGPTKTLPPPESLVLDNIPPIPAELAERAGRYTEFRAATLLDWHPTRREMLIATRFGDTNQVHLVSQPGGIRRQLTFFPDRVEGAVFEPTQGDYFIFHKGTGGAEFFQNYRYDLATGDVTLLTDGKSRNSLPVFSNDGRRVAYTSTLRNGTDTDIYTEDPLDPKGAKLLAEVQGGGWEIQDWSPDDRQLLCIEGISINETYLWLIDTQTGQKTELTPRLVDGTKIARGKARFTRDGKGFFVSTDNESEVQRLAFYDLTTKQAHYFKTDAHGSWDVEDFEVSKDGKRVAVVVDENGASALYVLQYQRDSVGKITGESLQSMELENGVISSLRWHPNGRELGFTFANASSSADVFAFGADESHHPQATRWTQSETGGLNAARFARARLVKWKSFDGREISGFLYAPDPAKFPGPRPVIVNIHGGPESQYRPGYLGRNNYFINELGCAVIFPNVRGSAGYGKTFVKLDDGFLREDSYKDIAALFDWIAGQPGLLDKDRIMVTGGSYGGHMTLAVAANYADRIRCALSVVGISNLKTFLERTESYRRDLRRVEYGDERDPKMAAFLERIAPLNNATKITKPLFIVQGANDPRVPRSEAEQMVATLKKQSTPVPYLLAKDEGHGFAKKKNADFQFYATVEFIRRYLLNP